VHEPGNTVGGGGHSAHPTSGRALNRQHFHRRRFMSDSEVRFVA
jgi:hypothetical protein